MTLPICCPLQLSPYLDVFHSKNVHTVYIYLQLSQVYLLGKRFFSFLAINFNFLLAVCPVIHYVVLIDYILTSDLRNHYNSNCARKCQSNYIAIRSTSDCSEVPLHKLQEKSGCCLSVKHAYPGQLNSKFTAFIPT